MMIPPVDWEEDKEEDARTEWQGQFIMLCTGTETLPTDRLRSSSSLIHSLDSHDFLFLKEDKHIADQINVKHSVNSPTN